MDTTPPKFPVHPSAIVLATFSLINLLIDSPPFLFHVRARNVAASSLVLWTLLMNLTNLINALLWPTDDISRWWSGIILCDIEVKLFIGSQLGRLGALICIMQELARVLDTDHMSLGRSKGEERRRMVWELVMCWGTPVLSMLCHYVVQPSRYAIWGISGCEAMIDNSWPSVVLVQVWPVIFALVDIYYSGVVVYRIHRYRTQFSSLLAASGTNKSRFLRLFFIALSFDIIFFPLTVYVFYGNVNGEYIPYSWDRVHDSQAWSELMMVPSNGKPFLDQWIRVISGIFVFLGFGLGTDAMAMYRSALLAIGLGRIFPGLKEGSRKRQPSSSGSSSSFGSRAKSFIKRKWLRSQTAGTDLTINSPTSTTGLMDPPPSKIKPWYRRIFRTRSHDGDNTTHLPMWNPYSAAQPHSPISVVTSVTATGKEVTTSAAPVVEEMTAVDSLDAEIESELRKEHRAGI